MRKKKTERQKLIEKLDDLTREILYIRFGKQCVMCESTEQIGVGHIFSRKHLETRWDIDEKGNCYPQCWKHNFAHVRDQYPYFNWFIEKYGKDELDFLRARHSISTHLKDWNLKEKVEEYEKLIKSGELYLL
jgi:hypothetical protein